MRLHCCLTALTLSTALMISCGSEEQRNVLLEQVTELRSEVNTLEQEPGADDLAAFLAESRQQLDELNTQVMAADDFQQVKIQLHDLTQSLAAARDSLTEPPIPSLGSRLAGDAFYTGDSSEEPQPYTPAVPRKRVSTLTTQAKSAVIWRLNNDARLHLRASSTMHILNHGSLTTPVTLRLNKGVLHVYSSDSMPTFSLMAGAFVGSTDQNTWVEFSTADNGEPDYLVVHRGRVTWEENGVQGVVTQNQGLIWQAGERQHYNTALQPVIESPNSGETVTIPASIGTVSFQWSSPNPKRFAFELSADPQFLTPLVNQQVKQTTTQENLKVGTYYWRVRSFGQDYLPGVYSRRAVVVVAANEDTPRETTTGKDGAQGPPLEDIKIELMGGTGIVTGVTSVGAIVRVKGSPAVMLEDGNFRAVVNFLKEGEQLVEITAFDPTTSTTTVVNRTVKVNY